LIHKEKHMSKLIQIVKSQLAWQKLPELDQQIIRAEHDMIEAYVRWQKMLAAREAERAAKQNVALMIRDVYQQHQFEA
jgi:TRAP-type C4-dicarboxylate transport system substrate-binding protein